MPEIKKEAVKFAISSIDDGWIFEEFAQKFLSARFSFEFIPVGGTRDKGIDGLQHVYVRKGFIKQVYQISTEKAWEGKIKRTIEVLRENKVSFDSITYISNRNITDKDSLINALYDQNAIPLKIYDVNWFVTSVDYNEGTKNAYFTFIDSHMHEFTQPGKSFKVSKIDTDSRLFVFLRQQLDSKWSEFKIDDLLADSLIMFALEGTDPDLKIFKKSEEIFQSIRDYIKFDPKLLNSTITRRLEALSTKPRKINHHRKEDEYCLPYETRLEIAQRNLTDKELQLNFFEQTETVVRKYLKENSIAVRDVTELINEVIHRIFYQQGLEFSNFVLHGKSQEAVEKDLQETINIAVDESSVIVKNKELVKVCLLMAIRDIVYNGTFEQRRYFKSLSNTYMMMFLLQWNPQVAMYFESMASKLNIYVCTSIIVPAFSEYYLDEENKRHWNLLKCSKEAGIRLFISDAIVDELVHHFRMIKAKYESLYSYDDNYLMSEIEILYIDEILIRAYFHAKLKGKVASFYDFVNNFCDPELKNPKDELIDYLKHEFAIIYITDSKLKISLNSDEEYKLVQKLQEQKKSSGKAKTDAKIILSIYKIRERDSETTSAGIFGYKTWWLSKDTATYLAVKEVFKDKYPVSCYIRPDFLYNHIALAPKKLEVDTLYRQIFPTLLGVNLSFHLPKDVTLYVQEKLMEYSTKNPNRVKAIIRQLTEKLQSDPNARNGKYVKHFLDEELKNILTKK